jgi:hypothetical protein
MPHRDGRITSRSGIEIYSHDLEDIRHITDQAKEEISIPSPDADISLAAR